MVQEPSSDNWVAVDQRSPRAQSNCTVPRSLIELGPNVFSCDGHSSPNHLPLFLLVPPSLLNPRARPFVPNQTWQQDSLLPVSPSSGSPLSTALNTPATPSMSTLPSVISSFCLPPPHAMPSTTSAVCSVTATQNTVTPLCHQPKATASAAILHQGRYTHLTLRLKETVFNILAKTNSPSKPIPIRKMERLIITANGVSLAGVDWFSKNGTRILRDVESIAWVGRRVVDKSALRHFGNFPITLGPVFGFPGAETMVGYHDVSIGRTLLPSLSTFRRATDSIFPLQDTTGMTVVDDLGRPSHWNKKRLEVHKDSHKHVVNVLCDIRAQPDQTRSFPKFSGPIPERLVVIFRLPHDAHSQQVQHCSSSFGQSIYSWPFRVPHSQVIVVGCHDILNLSPGLLGLPHGSKMDKLINTVSKFRMVRDALPLSDTGCGLWLITHRQYREMVGLAQYDLEFLLVPETAGRPVVAVPVIQ